MAMIDPEQIDRADNNFQFYKPLDHSEKQIRLLRLAASNDEDDVQLWGILEIVSLVSTPLPQYETLSYCWGDMKDTKTIEILQEASEYGGEAGQQLAITNNLARALQRIRFKDRPRTLWIDAICINQNDPVERALQVNFMQSVYKNAEKTVVWLGEGDETVGPALNLMVRIVRKIAHFDEPALEQNDHHESSIAQELGSHFLDLKAPGNLVSSTSDLPPADSTSWTALARLLSRPWFTRVWVLQEVAVSRQATVYCGEHELDWSAFGLAAAWLSRNNILAQTGSEGFRATDNVTLMFLFANPEVLRRQGSDPLALLWMMKDYDATDARDKLFASLGLIYNDDSESRWPHLLKPNYTKTTEDVYRDLVIHLLRENQNLDVLSMVQPHRASVQAPSEIHGGIFAFHLQNLPIPVEFPSWIPRWEYGYGGGNSGPLGLFPDPPAGIRPLYQASAALGLRPVSLESQANPGSLLVRGLKLDRITSLTELIWANYVDLDLNSQPSIGSPARSHRNTLRQVWTRYQNLLLAYPMGDDPMAVLRLLMVANRTRMKARADEDPTSEADFAAYLHEIGFDMKSESIPRDYQKRYADLHQTGVGDARRYSRDLVHSCSARKLFATSLGYMGLCHNGAREGDIVVMLFGGKVLYVLRPNGRTAGGGSQTWTFLGEAYVHGLMDGGALSMQRAFKEPSEVFDLR